MNNLIEEKSPFTFFKLTSSDYFSFQINLEKIESLFGLKFLYTKNNIFYYTIVDSVKYNNYKLLINK
jgi:hypothetical protein